MRAVVQERYGSPADLQVREVPDPVPGPSEVLVRVRAASLHPDVWHVVAGRPAVLRLMGGGLRRPKQPIPGTDMAGVVERVGDAVRSFEPGDAVFGETLLQQQWANGGAFAEFVAVPESLLARKPEDVSFEAAASVPSSGFITLLNLRGTADWPPGRRVLVNGAGGGVGTIALQILKAASAHVTVVDVAGKEAMLRELGADAFLDCEAVDFTTRGERYDLVFDVLGQRPLREIRPALEPDGRYVPIGHDGYGAHGRPILGLVPKFLSLILRSRFDRNLRGSGLPAPTKADAVAELRDLLASGTLTPRIDRVFELAEVREAFRHLMEDELHGKVLLAPAAAG